MSYKFSSAITRGGSIIRPDVIEIDSQSVTYKKRNSYLINSDTISIPLKQVSSIKIDTSIIGTTITIEGTGRSKITAVKFSKSDASKIKRIIERLQAPDPSPLKHAEPRVKSPKKEKVKPNDYLQDKIEELEGRIELLTYNTTNEVHLSQQETENFFNEPYNAPLYEKEPTVAVEKSQLEKKIDSIEGRMTLRELRLKDLEAIKSNPHTKWLYWPKLIWGIYLDTLWKKLLFVFIVWTIVAQILILFI